LRSADTLPIEYLAKVAVGADGIASVAVELPMPGVRSLRLSRR
jgi:xylan 1,4-beta-xylosidase